MAVNIKKLKNMAPPKGMEFPIGKVGDVVLQVTGLECSTAFYTEVLDFKVADIHPDKMMPGGTVQFRDSDNHSLEIYRGVAQVGNDGRVWFTDEWHGVRSIEEAVANPLPGQNAHIPR